MRFLIFGDVVGRAGRQAVTQALPTLKDKLGPDAVIINIENIAHGRGLSPTTMQEAAAWQADVYTSGDHAWDNDAGLPLLDDKDTPLIRPANYPAGVPGRGYLTFRKGAFTVAVINLQGQVFFRNHPLNPFLALDDLLQKPDIASVNVVLVDLHAEATSEKRGFGWYADGRISSVWGTHTHVPTADAQILPKGTGYITDVGMTGAYHSIIGMSPAGPLRTFQQQLSTKFVPQEEGPLEVNALSLDVDPRTGHTTAIAHIRNILDPL